MRLQNWPRRCILSHLSRTPLDSHIRPVQTIPKKASVSLCYSGFDVGETVDAMDSFASDGGIIDVTGCGLESVSSLETLFTKGGKDLAADLSNCVDDMWMDLAGFALHNSDDDVCCSVMECTNFHDFEWEYVFNYAREVDQSLWPSGEVDVVSFKQQFESTRSPIWIWMCGLRSPIYLSTVS